MHTVSAYEDYWCPASEGHDMPAIPPISEQQRIALLKIVGGDWKIPASDLACLLERKLVEISSGLVRLTQDGYIALGLPV